VTRRKSVFKEGEVLKYLLTRTERKDKVAARIWKSFGKKCEPKMLGSVHMLIMF
jgi:hypothetical protein